MAREILTDEQVAMEIDRLNDSKYVQLARKEQRLKYKQRQYMYNLRCLERRGRQLEAEGVTLENIERLIAEIPESDNPASE